VPVSPVDEKQGLAVPPGAVEMQGHLNPHRAEVSGDGTLSPYGRVQELPHNQPYQQVQHNNGYLAMSGSQQQPMEMHVGTPLRATMNEGPLYEMDGRFNGHR